MSHKITECFAVSSQRRSFHWSPKGIKGEICTPTGREPGRARPGIVLHHKGGRDGGLARSELHRRPSAKAKKPSRFRWGGQDGQHPSIPPTFIWHIIHCRDPICSRGRLESRKQLRVFSVLPPFCLRNVIPPPQALPFIDPHCGSDQRGKQNIRFIEG